MRAGAAALGLQRGLMGQRHRDRGDGAVSGVELVALVCCDLGSIVRGRSLLAGELGTRLDAGVGWVPANQALTPLGPLAEPNPFGSTGDLRLLPDRATHVRVEADYPDSASRLTLCDIVETDGRPWDCCPRRFLREALAELDERAGRRVCWRASSTSSSCVDEAPPALPFSLEAQRRAEPFAARADGRAGRSRRASPSVHDPEFAAHQFEIPVAPAAGLAAADRSVVFKEVVREIARRHELRASFAPLTRSGRRGQRRAHPSQPPRRRPGVRCSTTRRVRRA